MVQFIFLLVIVAMFFIAKRYMAMRREMHLRENPPKRRVIEVCLPRGISDSNKRMAKFYRQASSAALGSEKERRAGLRQLDIVYLAEVAENRTMADIRFLVMVDEDKMDTIKRSIKQQFDGMADVMELQQNPLAEIAAQLRPPKPAPASAQAPAEQELPEDPRAQMQRLQQAQGRQLPAAREDRSDGNAKPGRLAAWAARKEAEYNAKKKR